MEENKHFFNECTKIYGDKVLNCLNTWKNIPEDAIYKIKRCMNECAHLLLFNISSCKIINQPELNNKTIHYQNPYQFENRAYIHLKGASSFTSIEYFYSSSEKNNLKFEFNITKNNSISLWWGEYYNGEPLPIYSITDDNDLEY